MDKYHVSHISQSKEINEKKKETLRSHYGVDYPFQSQEILEKSKQTLLDKYGVDNISKVPAIQEKIESTFLEKYNATNPMKNKDILEKVKQTMIDRYGKENPSQVQEFKEKMMANKYKNQTIYTSRQQIYLHSIFGGEINYLFHGLALDIYLQDDNIVLEYDGGGHTLPIKTGKMSKEEFCNKESNREKTLIDNGLRIIRIISENDVLPNDDILKKIYTDSIKHFDNGASIIKYSIDHNTIDVDGNSSFFDYGELRKIKKSDIEEVA